MAIKVFVQEDDRAAARQILLDSGELTAPELILLEVASVLVRKCQQRQIAEDQVIQASRDLPLWFDALAAISKLQRDAVRLSFDLKHPVYDGAYLALGQQTGFDFVIADRRLHDAVLRAGLKRVRRL